MQSLSGKTTDSVSAAAVGLYRFSARNPAILAGFLFSVMISMLFYSASVIRTEVSLEGLLGENTAEVQAYQKFMHMFGHDQTFIFNYRDEQLLQSEGLQRLARIQHSLRSLHPQVSSVASVLDYPVADQSNGKLTIGSADDLLRSGRKFDVDAWLESNPATGQLINRSKNATLILVYPVAEENRDIPDPTVLAEILIAAENYVSEFQREGASLEFAGQGAFLGLVQQLMMKDLYFLPILSVGISLLLLFFAFKRTAGVIMPVLMVIPPVIFAFFIMALLDIPVRVSSILIPPALVVIGMASSVHLLTGFFRSHQGGMGAVEVMEGVIHEKAPALFTATLTTALAFAVFFSTPLAAVSEVGLIAALGTLSIFPFLVLVAALYLRFFSISPEVQESKDSDTLSGKYDSLFERVFSKIKSLAARLVISHARSVVFFAVILAALSLVLVKDIRLSHQPVNWLPHNHSLFVSSQTMEDEFTLSLSLELLIDSGLPGGSIDAGFMAEMIAAKEIVKRVPEYLPGAVISDSGSASLQEFYRSWLSSPGLIQRIFSDDYRYTRFNVRVPMKEGTDYQPAIDYLNTALTDLADRIQGSGWDFSVTGQPVIMAASHAGLISSAVQGYTMSLIVLIGVMMLFTRSFSTGVLLMLPNLLPLFLVVALMPVLNIPLDLMSMLVVSVAMGLVVDDTVHITASFRQKLAQGYTPEDAVIAAIDSAGRAMFLTTLVLVAGFQMLIFSNFESVFTFGWLTSGVMSLGLIADLLVAPALLYLLSDRRHRSISVEDSEQV